MSTVVKHTQDNRGCTTSLCPRCGTQWVYWDADDLDENGDLLCFCEEEEEGDDPCCLLWKQTHLQDHERDCPARLRQERSTFQLGDRVTILGGFEDGLSGIISGMLRTPSKGDGWSYSVLVGQTDFLGFSAARLIREDEPSTKAERAAVKQAAAQARAKRDAERRARK